MKKQINKKIYLLPIVILMTLMTFVLVGATIELNVPVTNTNYTTITFNCTQADGDIKNSLNASIYYNASGGDTGTYLGKIDNDTANDLDFTNSISIESLSDALTYNFTCMLDNGTDQTYSVGIGSVGIDNTAPSISLTTDYSEVNQNRYFKYTTSLSDATSGLDGTETCSITDPLSDETSVSTSASDVFWKDTSTKGDYVLECSSTDTAGNTNSDSVTVEVKILGKPIERKDEIGNIFGDIFSDSKNILIAIIVFVVIVAIISKK